MEKISIEKKKRQCIRHLYDYLDCTGVYGILYLPDMMFRYIGCSKNIKGRWKDHRCHTKGKQYNDDFHKDLRANPDKYKCVVLYKYDGIIKGYSDLYEILVPIECGYIREYKALGHPLVTTVENNLGTRKPTDEEKAKRIAVVKGKYVGENSNVHGKIWITNGVDDKRKTIQEYNDKYQKLEWTIGRSKNTHTDEQHRKKQSDVIKLKWTDTEYHQKMCKKMQEANNRPEVREKIGKKSKERWQDNEYYKKMCETKTGRIWITNDIEEHFITVDDFNNKYKQLGFRRGRLNSRK